MPELPDVELYITALGRFIGGRKIDSILVKSPFLVRSIEPPIEACVGETVVEFHRLGKRIVWELKNGWYIVFHLMIAGRFHWKRRPMQPRGRNDLAAFRFGEQTLMLTEASTKKRAAIHLATTTDQLAEHCPPGIEPLACSLTEFRTALLAENHTLKRSLTSPRLFSGIGNAYSDEILHAARLSPVVWTTRLSDAEIERLYSATVDTLRHWTQLLREQMGDRFPEKVTAFRAGMAVHGRYRQPCPVCRTSVQRIVYAENETNYCPRCQTGGKLLADRSLSRLLRDDWPKSIDQLEAESDG